MQREKSEALRYASEGLIRDLLPVVDNMERAVRAAAEARSSGAGETSPAADALVTGVEMVLRQLREVLERAGSTRIPVPPGQAFDPTVTRPSSRSSPPRSRPGPLSTSSYRVTASTSGSCAPPR
jgi:molecular chaperone GrpE (heat shock protein)